MFTYICLVFYLSILLFSYIFMLKFHIMLFYIFLLNFIILIFTYFNYTFNFLNNKFVLKFLLCIIFLFWSKISLVSLSGICFEIFFIII